MAITVRLGANTIKITAPRGMTLAEILTDVKRDYPISDDVQATVNREEVDYDTLIEDESRVVLTNPAGEKG